MKSDFINFKNHFRICINSRMNYGWRFKFLAFWSKWNNEWGMYYMAPACTSRKPKLIQSPNGPNGLDFIWAESVKSPKAMDLCLGLGSWKPKKWKNLLCSFFFSKSVEEFGEKLKWRNPSLWFRQLRLLEPSLRFHSGAILLLFLQLSSPDIPYLIHLPPFFLRYGFMFGRESARKDLGDLIQDLRRGTSNSDSSSSETPQSWFGTVWLFLRCV